MVEPFSEATLDESKQSVDRLSSQPQFFGNLGLAFSCQASRDDLRRVRR